MAILHRAWIAHDFAQEAIFFNGVCLQDRIEKLDEEPACRAEWLEGGGDRGAAWLAAWRGWRTGRIDRRRQPARLEMRGAARSCRVRADEPRHRTDRVRAGAPAATHHWLPDD